MKQKPLITTIKAMAETKNEKLLAMSGVWKNTKLDNDLLWKEILTMKNRKEPVNEPKHEQEILRK